MNGRVLSVNVSPGGLPKLPVERSWVGELGLEGDKHHDDTAHGGPFRAVCLFGIEAIERLQAEGHPVAAGSVGENLTTSGVDWSLLPGGTRVRVGERLLLELVEAAMPCETQRHNFIRGEFKRMSIVLFPNDSRMYARVAVEGEVRPGDPIEVMPLTTGHDADLWTRLFRIDEAELKADVRLWTAAASLGLDIHVSAVDELAMAAAADAPEAPFNHAVGLRTLPNLLPRVLDFYREHRVPGAFGIDRAPWLGAVPDYQLAVFAADAADLDPTAGNGAAQLPDGVTIGHVDPTDAAAWLDVVVPSFGEADFDMDLWRGVLPNVLRSRGVFGVLVESRGKAVAAALLCVHKRVGLLRTATVVPEARGQGLQRALIRERIRIAIADGCTLIAAHALAGGISACNLEACGLPLVGTRDIYHFDPAADPVPELTERALAR